MRAIPAAHRTAAIKAVALCLALAAATASPDTVTLKNGDVLKCKVVRETKELVKVRMPRRGKIVTAFLNRGAIDSIDRLPDIENRRLFQASGVRNPTKGFEPVYYSGIVTTAAGAKPATPGGKPGTKPALRGVEARRKASEDRAKARSSDRSKDSTPAEPSVAPVAPVTSGGASTSTSFGGRSGGTSSNSSQ